MLGGDEDALVIFEEFENLDDIFNLDLFEFAKVPGDIIGWGLDDFESHWYFEIVMVGVVDPETLSTLECFIGRKGISACNFLVK